MRLRNAEKFKRNLASTILKPMTSPIPELRYYQISYEATAFGRMSILVGLSMPKALSTLMRFQKPVQFSLLIFAYETINLHKYMTEKWQETQKKPNVY